ncbi:uncharacterized protein LOC116167562 [Photinus pyralis]|uniref:uncharacterized protein LOC116160133 n=1 Tax=Photinus pyralis TaxID=7054 RepID=UPI0012670A9D|nr:uncharacterized protein LOC116160133 [Photinus pyralis]XP_031338806.1 uncharacterized protein LOC116167556 [Photinus pyralis]XP_031338817.1 uncharacterized protein LOC116167562 [Photinus pyralis]
MYFKLVLASVGLMCIGFVSGSGTRYCHECGTGRSKDFQNCRQFVNITKSCYRSPPGYCIFIVGNKTEDNKVVDFASRICSIRNCDWHRLYNKANKHCSQCESDYCNTDKF